MKDGVGYGADTAAVREKVNWEYKIVTTPQYTIAGEDWELYEVLLKTSKGEPPYFIAVFRKQMWVADKLQPQEQLDSCEDN